MCHRGWRRRHGSTARVKQPVQCARARRRPTKSRPGPAAYPPRWRVARLPRSSGMPGVHLRAGLRTGGRHPGRPRPSWAAFCAPAPCRTASSRSSRPCSTCSRSFLAFFSETVVSRGGSWRLSSAVDPGLQLAAALELGVELGAEQQRQVGDPQPEQEDDDPGQRRRRSCCRCRIGDVEAEGRRGQDPHEDGDGGADADPAELRLLHVGRRVVEDRRR